MDRAFVRFFVLLLLIVILCSGCGQKNIIVLSNSDSEKSDSVKVIKYRNGAVVLKSCDSKPQKTETFGNNIVSINFEPKDINFDR